MLAACGDWRSAPLPFPTPAQHDLVVLVRPGPLTHDGDEGSVVGRLERDLAEAFAKELGVGVRYEIVARAGLDKAIADGRYHLAAAWLSPLPEQGIAATPPLFMTRDVLAQHEASLPLTQPEQLTGKTVHVMASSRQAATLRQLAASIPDITVVEVYQDTILELLERLGERKVEYVVMDGQLADMANQYVPSLRTSLRLSEEQPIVWLLGPHPNSELAARANAFVERIHSDGTLARLVERYFGHVRRLRQTDITKFLGQIETTLPKLLGYFLAAEAVSGLDWRLIAAVAYQESHWDPNATSYTNVRGIMMLTEETADRLGVGNRLDAGESILAGARYINILRDMLPDEVKEPDRTWLALAAYNIGPGHMNGARTFAKQLEADPNAWYDMKRILPLLAKPDYYKRLKAGRARGGEAVILVENIRSYYDILSRNKTVPMAAKQPFSEMSGMSGTSANRPRL
ncbi:MAG: membrane-bound lytic murein transglycosylase MltF [Azonexus sp.]|uniref:membrane-bound lytic murein transglycosylase MltF n=1 Tax=Azonexus sp. TaxID=1872668 RepID=UPI0028193F99|nr:membrane-bound lytic murein transglycosylase MltF [Azonexus sp.]MDR0776907.1 membrane-bound lytic murein transglycosylase MltF [Azonexus sp.]